MNILFLMIPISLLLGAGFLGAFVWMANQGQWDDVVTPAHRILEEEGNTNEQS